MFFTDRQPGPARDAASPGSRRTSGRRGLGFSRQHAGVRAPGGAAGAEPRAVERPMRCAHHSCSAIGRSWPALFSEAGVTSAEITTRHGTARFPSIRTMVEAELRGWLPVVGVILTEDQIGRILQEAEHALGAYADRGRTSGVPLVGASRHREEALVCRIPKCQTAESCAFAVATAKPLSESRLRKLRRMSSPVGYTAQFFSNSWASRSYFATVPSQP